MTSYPSPQHPPQQSYPPTGYQAPPSNGMGVAGFVVSLSGLIICGGFLCPIGLVLSLIGLGKQPRGFAIAGTVIGLLGSAIAVFFVLAFAGVIGAGWGLSNWISGQWHTSFTIDSASWEIDNYFDNNNDTLPDQATGTGLINHHLDEWGNTLDYQPVQGSTTDYQISSAGPDMQFGTADDIINHYAAFSFSSQSGLQSNPLDNTGPGSAQIEYSFDQAAERISQQASASAQKPDEAAGNALILHMTDPWNQQLKYAPASGLGYHLKSAGPDRLWQTEDDITNTYYIEPAVGQ